MKSIIEFLLSRIPNKHIFTLADVGAKGGIPKKWDVISKNLKTIGFEPNELEFQKLKSCKNRIYVNHALHGKSEELRFFVTKEPGDSSIFKPNTSFRSQFPDSDRSQIKKELVLHRERVDTLDSVLKKHSISDLDFIKLDTQGSELLILKGAEESLDKVIGLQIEVEFSKIYENQTLFPEVDDYMRKKGYELIDLRRQFWKRKDYLNFPGKGQIIFGDALYFKNIDILFQELESKDREHSTSKIYKSILTCVIYGMFDYAVSIAKKGVETGFLSQSDYDTIFSKIKSFTKKQTVPHFPGKRKLYRLLRFMCQKLKPKSYLGWADSDEKIGNIIDI